MIEYYGISILIAITVGLVAAVLLDTLLKIKDTLKRIESLLKLKDK